jgi:hypothetical protein
MNGGVRDQAVTNADIAHLVGVSKRAVLHVINGRLNFLVPLRQRIESAIVTLGHKHAKTVSSFLKWKHIRSKFDGLPSCQTLKYGCAAESLTVMFFVAQEIRLYAKRLG